MMNNRIRELAEQAGAKPVYTEGLYKELLAGDVLPVGGLEKFAELIVRECAAVADGNFNTGFCPVGGFITEHFGFER
jgi:hypothetical protein